MFFSPIGKGHTGFDCKYSLFYIVGIFFFLNKHNKLRFCPQFQYFSFGYFNHNLWQIYAYTQRNSYCWCYWDLYAILFIDITRTNNICIAFDMWAHWVCVCVFVYAYGFVSVWVDVSAQCFVVGVYVTWYDLNVCVLFLLRANANTQSQFWQWHFDSTMALRMLRFHVALLRNCFFFSDEL